MELRTMLSRLFSRNRRTKQTPAKTRPRFRPYVEFLEDRITPSTTTYLPAVLSGSLTSGSKIVTVANASSPTILQVGEPVAGVGIQGGTTISAVNYTTNVVTLSKTATTGG